MTSGQFMPPVLPPRRASWPTAVGIISICLGSMNLFWVLAGAAMQSAATELPGKANVQMQLPEFRDLQISAQVLGSVVNLVLVTAGILVLKRRPLGRPLHLLYALLGIGSAAFGLYVAMTMMPAMLRKMAAVSPESGRMLGVMKASMTAGMVMGIAWGCAYPVFLLIWFHLSKVRLEVNRWTTGAASA
jgi:hypothetical protein